MTLRQAIITGLVTIVATGRATSPLAAQETAAATAPVTQPANRAILPGQSIGDINIGASSGEIRNLLGQPTHTYPRGTGMKEDVWERETGVPDSLDETRVIYASDQAIQIKVTSSKFELPGGFNTGLKLAQVFQQFKNLTVTAYTYNAPEGGGWAAYLYDDAARGLAFEVTAQDYFDHSISVGAIIVHRTGVAVKPDHGAAPSKLTLNQPLQPEPAPRKLAARGNGLPLEEDYADDGTYSVTTSPILTKSQIVVMGIANVSRNGYRFEHPFTFLMVGTVQQSAVWQDANSITLAFGNRRVRLAAAKSTTEGAYGTTTGLIARVPIAVFRELAGHKRIFIEVAGNAFEIPESQTLGLRTMAAALAGRPTPRASTSSSSSASYTLGSRRIKKGMAGTDVLAWQRFLVRRGYMEPPAQGNFGERTDRATRAFQRRYGLTVDGVVGPQTLRRARRLGL